MALSLPSRLLQRYCLIRLLGSNGERRTWLATDEQTGTQVTLKTLYFGQDLDWQQFEPFERQLQVLPKLDHPLIPKFLDTFWLEEPEGHYFCIVQQFVPGVSLAERFTKGERFERSQVEELARDLLGVLIYMHSQDPPLVHRDIKPSNLIWGDDQKIHLIDFGAAQVMGHEGRTLTVAGTFGYMAPEQFVGRATSASDLYSLGATLVQLLTGLSPRDLVDSAGNLHLPKHASLSGWLGYWLERMIEPKLKYRFSSASEALVAFEKKQQGITVSRNEPLSSIQRFIVDECNQDRLRVTLSLNSNGSEDYRRKGHLFLLVLIAYIGTILFSSWKLNHIVGSLIASTPVILGTIFGIVYILYFALRKNQIIIGDGYCQFDQKALFGLIQHFKFSFGSQAELLVLKQEPIQWPYSSIQKIPKTTLQLKDRRTGKSVQFKVCLDEAELDWLQKQFQIRKERTSPQVEE